MPEYIFKKKNISLPVLKDGDFYISQPTDKSPKIIGSREWLDRWITNAGWMYRGTLEDWRRAGFQV
ncbi:MAG TPA: hypothetical protein PK360_17565 [bacterium]|nr:hypothetical protein [bacterium]